MSVVTPKNLAASLFKKLSPARVAEDEDSIGDVDKFLMKSPNRRDADDIEDVEGAEYESYKGKGGAVGEGLGAQPTIGSFLKQIENRSPFKEQGTKGAKGKANAK